MKRGWNIFYGIEKLFRWGIQGVKWVLKKTVCHANQYVDDFLADHWDSWKFRLGYRVFKVFLTFGVVALWMRSRATYERVVNRKLVLIRSEKERYLLPPNVVENGRYVMVKAVNTALRIEQPFQCTAAQNIAINGDMEEVHRAGRERGRNVM